ncbi:hypothetical protein [Paenibacillus sp. FSL R5-0914]|uniref:hypothetical protein n=1 Tax=Paenibacillus sp. FSL R5-0914 TaxID=2921665 RepID=UPI0030F57566
MKKENELQKLKQDNQIYYPVFEINGEGCYGRLENKKSDSIVEKKRKIEIDQQDTK